MNERSQALQRSVPAPSSSLLNPPPWTSGTTPLPTEEGATITSTPNTADTASPTSTQPCLRSFRRRRRPTTTTSSFTSVIPLLSLDTSNLFANYVFVTPTYESKTLHPAGDPVFGSTTSVGDHYLEETANEATTTDLYPPSSSPPVVSGTIRYMYQ